MGSRGQVLTSLVIPRRLTLKQIREKHSILYVISYRHSLGDCASSKLYLSVCMSRFNGLYLGFYGSDFDKTRWKC